MTLLRTRLLFALVICLGLSACKVELYGGLPESEANQMMAALITRGVATTKTSGKDGFVLSVDRNQFGAAVGILESVGLPSQRFSSVGTMFEETGLVSSPLQERARLNYAKSQELSQSIAVIQGVIKVSVQIAEQMDKDPLQGEAPQTTASVVIQMREDYLYDEVIPQVKQIVAFAIPDIEYDNVGVVVTSVREAIQATQLESFMGLIVDAPSLATLQALVIALVVTTLGSLAGGGYALWLFWRARRNKTAGQTVGALS